ncbi:MAG: TonB-dependent receptor [Pseudomonas sp.]
MTRNPSKNRPAPCLLLLALPCLTAPALAQQTDADTTAATAASGTTANSQSDKKPVQLSAVTVSAERRESNLQKTAASVTVLDGEQLRKENKLTIADIVESTPGVEMQDGAEGPTFIIRGTSNNLSPNTESPNAIYIDGVYTDRGDVSRAAFYDLQRVEVLRGPQGTLFGANAVGGAINIITNDPVLNETSGLIKLGVGNYSDRRSEGVLNLPINDVLAIRTAFATDKRDGYMSTGQQDNDMASARVKLLYRPSDTFSMVVGAQYNRLGGKGPGAAYVDDLTTPWYSSLPSDSVKHVRTSLLDANLQWDFDSFKLVYVPTWYKDHFDADSSYSGTQQLQTYDKWQLTQELRIQSQKDSPIQWVAGINYLASNAPQTILVKSQPINAWTYTPYQRTRAWAGFGQVTVPISEDFRLTGGLRYSYDTRSILQVDVPYDSSQYYTITNEGIAYKDTFKKTTWKIGAEKDLGESHMLYANVSTGFRAGGFYADNEYAPETVTSYVLGSKNRFFDNRLQLNLEGYLNKFDNYQLSYYDDSTEETGIYSAQNVQVRGGELEGSWMIGMNDKLDFSVAYMHSQVGKQDSVPDLVTLSEGQALNHSPRWSSNLNYQHIWDLPNGGSLTASGKYHNQTGYWAYYTRADGSWQHAYHQSDAYLTYDSPDGRWSVGAYVTNIENVPVITVYSPAAGGIVQLGAPRLYGVQVTRSF